jgi:hypothetical protein
MVPKLRYGGLIFVINFCPGWAHFILQLTIESTAPEKSTFSQSANALPATVSTDQDNWEIAYTSLKHDQDLPASEKQVQNG